jgi:hypothetical protein
MLPAPPRPRDTSTTLLLLLAFAAAACGGAGEQAQSSEPKGARSAALTGTGSVSLYPTTVSNALASSNISVSGSGYTPNATVTISWAGSQLATIAASSTGTFSAFVAEPANQNAGSYTITATDTAGLTGSATFTVTTPAISLSSNTGEAGIVVDLSGSGFESSKTFTVMWNQTTSLTTVTTDAFGFFDYALTIPSTAAYGSVNTVGIQDGNAFPLATYTVTRSLTLPITSGDCRSTLTYSGKGFAASGTVKVWMTGNVNKKSTTLSSITASSTGTISGSVTIPSVSPGNYTVKATDSTGTVSGSYLVTNCGYVSAVKACTNSAVLAYDKYHLYFHDTVPGTTPTVNWNCSSTHQYGGGPTNSSGYGEISDEWWITAQNGPTGMPWDCWSASATDGDNGRASSWSGCSCGCASTLNCSNGY